MLHHRPARVLVVDGVADRRQALCVRLGESGHVVLVAVADMGLGPVIDVFEPDVIVARLGGAPEEAVPFLRRGREIPVIVIATADCPSQSRVAARLAAVEHIFTEPLDVDELVACVDVMVSDRRRGHVVRAGDLTIDRDTHVVRRNDVDVQLTPIEYHLLVDLTTNQGQVLSKRRLLERIWGFDGYDVNVVEVHISSLRRKLEASGPRLIQTVRGFGYMMRRLPASEQTAVGKRPTLAGQ